MDAQALGFEMDMATMALKGKRFREAEHKFKDLAQQTNSAEAWAGMGISKYGLILEDVTVEEVFYSFGKAKGIDPAKVSDLEEVVIETSLDVVRNLYEVLKTTEQSIDKAKTAQSGAALAAVLGTAITVRNNIKGRAFGSIASAGLTALSYSSYVKAGATVQEMNELHDRVKGLIQSIDQHLKDFAGNDARLVSFNETISLSNKHVREVEVVKPMATDLDKMKSNVRLLSIGVGIFIFLALICLPGLFKGEDEHRSDGFAYITAMIVMVFYLRYKKQKLKKEIEQKEAEIKRHN